MSVKCLVVKSGASIYTGKSASTKITMTVPLNTEITIESWEATTFMLILACPSMPQLVNKYIGKVFITKKDTSVEDAVSSEAANETATSEAAGFTYGYVLNPNASTVTIYDSNKKKAKVIGSITNWTGVQVLSAVGDYYQITGNATNVGEVTGYVLKKLLTVAMPNSSTVLSTKEAYVQYATDVGTSMRSVQTITSSISASTDLTIEKLLVKSLNGIHGVPYQFMGTVDRRLSSKVPFGRKYIERIVSKMPLLIMSPGAPDFMPAYSDDDKIGIVGALMNRLSDKPLESDITSLLSKEGRYYTFKFSYTAYYQYINKMLRMCAVFLGIQDKRHGNGMGSTGAYTAALGSFSWQYAVNSQLKGFINAQEFVAFYIDSDTSVSENFNNNSTQSQIASSVNTISDTAREIAFLAGPIAGYNLDALSTEDYASTYADIQDIANKYLNGSKLFTNLSEAFTTVAKGGKMLFPEIWSDSDWSRSYDIVFKFKTPDGDKMSWYLNILVPLIHLMAFAAPQQMGANGYKSPFLVRAYYKGLYNCDMGIVSSLSITKGKEGAWTVDGLPTEVECNMSLKDLYSFLSISNSDSADSVKSFLNNTALMDYLATSCGININKPEIERTLETYVLFTKNAINDIRGDVWMALEEATSNYARMAYAKLNSL